MTKGTGFLGIETTLIQYTFLSDLIYLIDRGCRQSVVVPFQELYGRIASKQGTSPSQPRMTACVLIVPILTSVQSFRRVLDYATNQRIVLLEDCFNSSILLLCISTKLSQASLQRSISIALRCSVVFPIKKALYKSR